MILKLIAGFVIIALLVTGYFVFINPISFSSSPPQKLTFENLPEVLSKHSFVKKLTNDASIDLRFYSGTQDNVEHAYIITKGLVKPGTSDNVDVVIYIPSKYMTDMTTANLCQTFTTAATNNELAANTALSKTELAWKFHSLVGCLKL